MTVAIDDLIKLTLFYVAPNASVANSVFMFRVLLAAEEEDIVVDTLEDWVTTFWGADWASLASTTATLESMEVNKMNADGTVAANLGVRQLDIPGLEPGSVLPAGNAGYLLAQTEKPKQRGSKYVPFISETTVDNGAFSTTANADLALMLLAYLAAINMPGGGRLKPGLLSRTLAAFVQFSPEGLVNDIPAYQRRRKPNVGS